MYVICSLEKILVLFAQPSVASRNRNATPSNPLADRVRDERQNAFTKTGETRPVSNSCKKKFSISKVRLTDYSIPTPAPPRNRGIAIRYTLLLRHHCSNLCLWNPITHFKHHRLQGHVIITLPSNTVNPLVSPAGQVSLETGGKLIHSLFLSATICELPVFPWFRPSAYRITELIYVVSAYGYHTPAGTASTSTCLAF
jgi:hypothetical protein